jgi:hypothetical protein
VLLVVETSSDPAPPAPDHGSVERRRDAVVDAARTLEDLSPQGVEAHVRRRWRGDRPLAPEDIHSFSVDARAQRVHDVADALDFRIRRAVHGRASTRRPHVSIPRGIVGKSLAALDPQEMGQVFTRLKQRGWTPQEIKKHGIRRFDKDGKMSGILESEG